MGEIATAVLEEKIAELSRRLTERDFVITALTHKVGKGKNVSISKGEIKQANATIESVDWRSLSSGELRVTVTQREKESKK